MTKPTAADDAPLTVSADEATTTARRFGLFTFLVVLLGAAAAKTWTSSTRRCRARCPGCCAGCP